MKGKLITLVVLLLFVVALTLQEARPSYATETRYLVGWDVQPRVIYASSLPYDNYRISIIVKAYIPECYKDTWRFQAKLLTI